MFEFLKKRKAEPVAPIADMPPIPEPPGFNDEPSPPENKFQLDDPAQENVSPEVPESFQMTPEEPAEMPESEPPSLEEGDFEKKTEDLLDNVELPSPPEELPGASFDTLPPKPEREDVGIFKPEELHEAEMMVPQEHFLFEEPPEEEFADKPAEDKEQAWQQVNWAEEPKPELLELPKPEVAEQEAEEPEAAVVDTQEMVPLPPKPEEQPEEQPEEDFELPDFDDNAEIFTPEDAEIPKPVMTESLPEIEENIPEDIFVSSEDYHRIIANFQELTKTLGKSYNCLNSIGRMNDEQKGQFETFFAFINQAQDSLISIDKKLFEKR